MPVPGVVCVRSTEVVAFSSVPAVVRLRQTAVSEELLALWNPAALRDAKYRRRWIAWRFLDHGRKRRRLFALTTSGLSIVHLASVPLGIGTLNPASGTASGGVTVTVRGSGFKSEIPATLGGRPPR
jgi:IPT/TIG domain